MEYKQKLVLVTAALVCVCVCSGLFRKTSQKENVNELINSVIIEQLL